ncbi:cobalt ECF transporter T component CbiQ [uncultured Cohaesibacter sp.]|uniref:cobalt ECF transporter T component CbiQ n=1 Tax=uncultured Cohaesibacter sp. TaxID=1002546 RepID=UPI00292ECA5D|nr:cobalt ECF transporter T component CbiQ [uncultured Cohaesibacter sp.]
MSDLLEEAGRARIAASAPSVSEGSYPHSTQTWIRGLDPRVRILVIFAYSICVIQLTSLPLLAFSLLLSLILMVKAQLQFWASVKRVAMMDSFIIFILVMLPFTTPGVELFSIWGFSASYEGVHQAVVVLLRANAIVMASLTLLGTLDPATFGHALARIHVPERLVHLLLFTIRYIEILHDEYRRLRTAMKCRAFSPSNSWHTYRTFGYLVGMLLIRSFERSERIMKAMKCRGFNGQFHLLQEFDYSRSDYVFSAIAAAVMVAMLTLEVLDVAIV